MPQVFISYAREDNATPAEQTTGWVSYFFNSLDYELRQRGRRDVKLWRDRLDIRDFEQFADDIDEGLRSSDIMVALMSPNYLISDWCARELERFAQLVGDGRTAREKLFKVLKRHVDHSVIPEPLQGQNGYHFFKTDRESNRLIELYHPQTNAAGEYWTIMGALADDLDSQLPKSEGSGNGLAEPPPKTSFEPKGCVYLAYSTSDLLDEANRIRGELEAHNIQVLPEIGQTPPLDLASLRLEMEAATANADMTIHLLGQTPGFIPDGSANPLSLLQLEIAAELNKKRTIWLAPRQDIDPRQQGIIDSLKNGDTFHDGDELIADSFDQLKGHLVDTLANKAPKDDIAEQLARLQAQMEALMRQMAGR